MHITADIDDPGGTEGEELPQKVFVAAFAVGGSIIMAVWEGRKEKGMEEKIAKAVEVRKVGVVFSSGIVEDA